MKPEITEIQIVPTKPKAGLVGFASFVLNGWFYMGSIGIITKPQGGFRLLYPTKGGYNLFHPINKETAQEVEKKVIKKFEEVTKSYDRHYQINTQ
jgi:DNA-binding cell septation regulator SpoVG